MMMLKQKSVRLPLLLALPALLLIGCLVVFLIPDDPPPQPLPPEPLPLSNEPAPDGDGSDPLDADPDPRPRPKPRPDAPTDVGVANAMESEAEAAMVGVRSRLELKYKNAEYALDRSWTLQQVMRNLDRLTGTHFNATDYTLSFPEGVDDLAVITCATIQGRHLPDGALTMTVDLRTGKSTRQGRILARNADGFVLLGESEYRRISDVLRSAAVEHALLQAEAESGLASLDSNFELPEDSAFELSDFTATPVKGAPLSAEFACRTLRGEQLAETAVITINYATRTVTLSRVKSPGWMAVPDDRDEIKQRGEWALRDMARHTLRALAEGKATADIKPERDSNSWSWSYVGLHPFDVRLTFEEGNTQRVVLDVTTHFGRPLPFAKLRYVADQSSGTFEFSE